MKASPTTFLVARTPARPVEVQSSDVDPLYSLDSFNTCSDDSDCSSSDYEASTSISSDIGLYVTSRSAIDLRDLGNQIEIQRHRYDQDGIWPSSYCNCSSCQLYTIPETPEFDSRQSFESLELSTCASFSVDVDCVSVLIPRRKSLAETSILSDSDINCEDVSSNSSEFEHDTFSTTADWTYTPTTITSFAVNPSFISQCHLEETIDPTSKYSISPPLLQKSIPIEKSKVPIPKDLLPTGINETIASTDSFAHDETKGNSVGLPSLHIPKTINRLVTNLISHFKHKNNKTQSHTSTGSLTHVDSKNKLKSHGITKQKSHFSNNSKSSFTNIRLESTVIKIKVSMASLSSEQLLKNVTNIPKLSKSRRFWIRFKNTNVSDFLNSKVLTNNNNTPLQSRKQNILKN